MLTQLMLIAALLLIPTAISAQNRTTGKRTKVTHSRSATTKSSSLLKPAAPTPLSQKERTIKDLLYFPYGCFSDDIHTAEEASKQLSDTFGSCEYVNSLWPGLHKNQQYDFTYRSVPIGLCYIDWPYNRHWYHFYFDSKDEAELFYASMASDLKNAGIPLVNDKVYGGLSNRKRPVSIFKWVYIMPPTLVKEADPSNINLPNAVGKYLVELGVYKRKQR